MVLRTNILSVKSYANTWKDKNYPNIRRYSKH